MLTGVEDLRNAHDTPLIDGGAGGEVIPAVLVGIALH